MTAVELNEALRELGWTGAELARRTGYSLSSVSHYRTGKALVPEVIGAYLKMALAAKRVLD